MLGDRFRLQASAFLSVPVEWSSSDSSVVSVSPDGYVTCNAFGFAVIKANLIAAENRYVE